MDKRGLANYGIDITPQPRDGLQRIEVMGSGQFPEVDYLENLVLTNQGKSA